MSYDPSPRIDEDTFNLIDDALCALAERRAIWLGDDLETISLVASLIEQAEQWLPELVCDAHADGHDWAEIARALGMSLDEARLRFADSPTTDDSVWSDE